MQINSKANNCISKMNAHEFRQNWASISVMVDFCRRCKDHPKGNGQHCFCPMRLMFCPCGLIKPGPNVEWECCLLLPFLKLTLPRGSWVPSTVNTVPVSTLANLYHMSQAHLLVPSSYFNDSMGWKPVVGCSLLSGLSPYFCWFLFPKSGYLSYSYNIWAGCAPPPTPPK